MNMPPQPAPERASGQSPDPSVTPAISADPRAQHLSASLVFSILPAEPADRSAIEALLQVVGLGALHTGDEVTRFWVVRQSGSLVGCAACERHGDAAVLRCVAVLPRAQGCGIGTALVNTILRQMVASGVQSIALLAIGGHDFARRFGFLQVTPEALPHSLNETGRFIGTGQEPAAPMLLDLRGAVLVGPAERTDMPAVLAIYNDAVAHTTATYDYDPRSLDDQYALYDQKMQDGYAFFVARAVDGTVVGFSTYGLYRTRPGWRFACEHSVYVAAPWRGRRVGLSLLPPIMWHARKNGFHTMIGVVDAQNLASVRMHQRAGFTEVGTIREGGYKFGRWLDVAFLQAML